MGICPEELDSIRKHKDWNMLLKVNNVVKKFGGLVAVNKITFDVAEGEIVGLIGPNGAGKTTLFNCIAGYYRPEQGRIVFRGRDITGKRPYQICKEGLARTFQVVKPFGEMSVLDNVIVGAFARTSDFSSAQKYAMEVLEFVGLAHRAGDQARSLTIADRKRLELARALATRPVLLLLDEVMAGLNTTEVQEMLSLLRMVNSRGITLFIIEHIMAAMMNIAQRILVMHHGEKIAEGMPQQISQNAVVIQAYLGEEGLIA